MVRTKSELFYEKVDEYLWENRNYYLDRQIRLSNNFYDNHLIDKDEYYLSKRYFQKKCDCIDAVLDYFNSISNHSAQTLKFYLDVYLNSIIERSEFQISILPCCRSFNYLTFIDCLAERETAKEIKAKIFDIYSVSSQKKES